MGFKIETFLLFLSLSFFLRFVLTCFCHLATVKFLFSHPSHQVYKRLCPARARADEKVLARADERSFLVMFSCFCFQLCVRQLQNKGLTTFVEDYLLWHHFGKKTKEENLDLVHAFKQSIHSALSPRNLALFINSYLHRSDLQMQRPDKTSAKKVPALKSAALLITGDNSPHQDDVVNTNSRLDPEISNYFKVSESGGMPLEEQPHKVATSLILFLQGLGYCKLLILCALYSESPIY